jgi:hypothetical protein
LNSSSDLSARLSADCPRSSGADTCRSSAGAARSAGRRPRGPINHSPVAGNPREPAIARASPVARFEAESQRRFGQRSAGRSQSRNRCNRDRAGRGLNRDTSTGLEVLVPRRSASATSSASAGQSASAIGRLSTRSAARRSTVTAGSSRHDPHSAGTPTA